MFHSTKNISNVTIKEATLEIKRLQHIIDAEMKQCEHDMQPTVPYDPTDIWFSSGVGCTKCGYHPHAWYCHTSPTKECSYEKSKNWDRCDYCGLPDERK